MATKRELIAQARENADNFLCGVYADTSKDRGLLASAILSLCDVMEADADLPAARPSFIPTNDDWQQRMDRAVAAETERCAALVEDMARKFSAFPSTSQAVIRGVINDIRAGKPA